ncbi:unnamed protein product, partial [Closterium sp. NIES-53]
FLVTSFQPVPRGTEGAVSLEGTLAGLAAAVVLSAAALLTNQVNLEIVVRAMLEFPSDFLPASSQGHRGRSES